MSVDALRLAIGKALSQAGASGVSPEAREATLVGPLESVWPVLEELAGHMSRLARLPLLVFVGDHRVYSTQVDLMPRWCAYLKQDPDLGGRCARDEQIRATTDRGRRVCHAGMIVAQRQISLPIVNDITILFGSRWGSSGEAQHVRARFFHSLETAHSSARTALQSIAAAEQSASKGDAFTPEEERLMDSIQRTLELMVEATMSSHLRAVSMTHEVAIVLQGTSLFLQDLVEEARALGHEGLLSSEFVENADLVEAENECALYLLQNYLSDSGYTEYRKARPRQVESVSVAELVDRLIRIYARTERGRRLRFVNEVPSDCPSVRGYRMELERALHNVFSNAVKYSFVSSAEGDERRIRVYTRIPYATRGTAQEWALCLENYGVGLSVDEQHKAFRRGFRGAQGIRQVGFGAGIGLSEVQKIMTSMGGRARIRSQFLHEGRTGPVYLTTVTLAFHLSQ